MLRRAPWASFGNLLSSSTRLRRMSTIFGTCSISTGHSCWQAPPVTQAQISSSLIATLLGRRVTTRRVQVLPSVDDDHFWIERLASQKGRALLLAANDLGTRVEF